LYFPFAGASQNQALKKRLKAEQSEIPCRSRFFRRHIMKKWLISIMVIAFTLSLAGCNFLNFIKKQSPLQEQCNKQCEAWSKSYMQKYPSDKLTYESHYNKRLNKCFMLVTYSKSQLKSLKEISENKMYGSLLVKQNSKTLICNVLENKCKTEKEWDALVKPYMEE